VAKKKKKPSSNAVQYPEGVTVYGAEDGFRPFPEPADVFADRVEEHSRYLLPATTINLARAAPRQSGVVHLLVPIEPYDGMLGEYTSNWHNEHCFEDWISFRMEGDRCEFMADFRFFQRAMYEQDPPTDPDEQREVKELEAHYDRVIAAFESRRDFFRQHGWLHKQPEKYDPDDPEIEWNRAALMDDLGGTSFDGNWSHNGWESELPINRYPDPDRFPPVQHGDRICRAGRVVPRTKDGRDFLYIGSISMWNYIDETNGAMLLFFDPVDQIAISAIDWT
jgi:hypothetical protein